jgi:hypothetical protein
MDLTPYLETLRRGLTAAAAPGGPDMTRAADALAGSLEASARLSLLEALSDAAAEITTRLGSASVEVRLRGRDADLVVTEVGQPAPATAPPDAAPAVEGGDTARITLRLPEALKEQVERAAGAEGLSVNAWLVRAVAASVAAPATGSRPSDRHYGGRRVTGFAQA